VSIAGQPKVVAEAFLDVLEAAGIDTLFGLPGSTEAALLESVRARGFRYVLALHEGVAVSVADGYARMTGRVGAVGLHTSVGTLNGLAQMMNALRDRSPLLVTAGHKDRAVLSDEGFCALPGLLGAARAVTKWSHQSLSADAVPFDLAHAIRVATAPPRGPVYLAVPEDILGSPVEGRLDGALGIVTAPGMSSVAAADAVAAAAELLRRAARPLLVVGSFARRAEEEVAWLSHLAGLPIAATEFTDLSDMPIPTSDPRFVGLYGEDPAVLEGCDLVVGAGCRVFYPFSDASRPRLPDGAALVHIDDDATEIGRVTRAELSLLGDPKLTLGALASSIEALGGVAPDLLAQREERIAALQRGRAQRLAHERGKEASAGGSMRVETLADVLVRVLPPDAVVVEEAVRSARVLFRHLPLRRGQRLLRSSGGALGWGTPASVGAALGAPHRPVVAVVGDGSFNFSVQALWTAAQIGVSLVVIVVDNGGYLAVKRAIEHHLSVPMDPRRHPGTEIEGIDYRQLAASYGAEAVSVSGGAELADALAKALGSGGVWVVHVPVEPVRP